MTPLIDRNHDVLVVIDVQNDFCPAGALAVPDGDAVVPPINRIAQGYEHIVLTQDWHPPGHRSFASAHPGRTPYERIALPYGEQVLWPDHCIQDTPGAALHADPRLARAQLVLRKGFRAAIDSYSAFFENDQTTPTGLAGYLRERGLRRAVFVGLATDFCVAWSALDARRLGFEAVVLLEACRAIDIDGSLAQALARMREAGVMLIESSAATA